MPLSTYILAVTIFSLGTSEFMVAGILPSLSGSLGASLTQVGDLISVYAAGMVIGGPLLMLAMVRLKIPPRLALVALLCIYAAAQAVAATSGTLGLMAAMRVVTGMVGAACFGVALTLGADSVAPELRGRVASVILGGLMLATVLGVPLAIWIDERWGWRASFWLVVSLVLACAVALTVRSDLSGSTSGSDASTDLRREMAEFRNTQLWQVYATSALTIGAAFSVFSYAVPILTEVSGLPAHEMPGLLAAYGIANVAGNVVVGRLADRHAFLIMQIGLSLLVAALSIFALLAHMPSISAALFLTIGLTGIALNPAMAVRVMATARPSPLVNTVHASVINIGLGAGTWLGGLGISAGLGLRAPLWTGVALATLALISLHLPRTQDPPRQPAERAMNGE